MKRRNGRVSLDGTTLQKDYEVYSAERRLDPESN
jgi:hypothetical protein